MPRKTLSKKIRFEVFKRDSFTCQYCGKSAPDVVLSVDHIDPVAKGGSNDILNLITSCASCNQGKSDIPLDDNSTLAKQKAMLDELNEKREQLKLMIQWREELENFEEDQIEYLNRKIKEISGFSLNDNGKSKLKKWVNKYGFNDVADTIAISFEQYYKEEDDEQFEKAFAYIPRIIACKKRDADKPHMKKIYYIRGILRNRLHYFDQRKGLKALVDAYEAGASLDELEAIAVNVRNWTELREELGEKFDVWF